MSDTNIVLAEDNPDDQTLILRTLKQHNLANNVVLVKDGVEALEYLFSTGPHEGEPLPDPAVVLLDINMPRINGLEVLGRIRGDKRTKHIPVVMLTSSKEESDLARSYSLGVNSYVRKPVDFEEFRQSIAQLGLYWLLVNEPPAGVVRKFPD